MLSAPPERSAEAGFTLIELMVAMAASIVLVIALTVVMVSVLHETGTTYARIDATRQTRFALTTLENELHSACVGTGTSQNLAPIQAGSGGNALKFVSFTGSQINPTPVWHEVDYDPAAQTLTDNSYAVTGHNGRWTPAATPTSSAVLLRNVTSPSGAKVFQYFAYQGYPAPDGQDYWTIPDGTDSLPSGQTPAASPLAVPLSAGATGGAASTVEVMVTLDGGPSGTAPTGGFAPGTTDPETDVISLRLSTPPDEAPATSAGSYGPCE
jgi:hypothetical protein